MLVLSVIPLSANVMADVSLARTTAPDASPGKETAAAVRAPSPAERRLYVVATSHLDTQWRWTIQTTIAEYLPATLRDNFRLIADYPHYTFSFEGAFRYQLMKEYYPAEYARLKDFVAAGRWRVAGSWLDAVDVNVPAPESLIRHALYGNGFFAREFGAGSLDVYLPDCFGFGFALPSIAAHCGLRQFSTQKLTWGSAIGIPFDIGLWEGVDGSAILAAINPGEYVSRITGDLRADSTWAGRIERQGRTSGLYAAYRYFGVGDQGGAPDSASVAWLERSLIGEGDLEVLSTGSDQLVRDLTPEQTATLPRYRGELLMTSHGVGCYTSQAAMKRWNRKNELLADAAERASVAAHWLGGATYPRETLRQAWTRFLWHQFHDDLTGTSIPEAYAFSWNDEIVSLNQFAAVLTDAVGAVSRALDTRVEGVPLVVYNPLSIARTDLVEAQVRFTNPPPEHIRVFGPDGRETPSQIVGRKQRSLDIAFLARSPSVGFAVYDVRSGDTPCPLATELSWDPATGILENRRYRLQMTPSGIASIHDRVHGRDLLAAPVQLQLYDDEPGQWSAWEIDFEDIIGAPRATVAGAGEIAAEVGPARIRLAMGPDTCEGSLFRHSVTLAAGKAGDRIEYELEIDWHTPGTLLKAVFPLAVANERATYDLGLGAIERPTNSARLYEVPAQQWADLTAADGSYGIAVLNDCRYGWDKPDGHTLRLTLLHTPAIADGWKWIQDQRSQDLGRHRLKLALCAHAGGWAVDVPWQARRLNQPLWAFQTAPHRGELGREFSLLEVTTGPSEAAAQRGDHPPRARIDRTPWPRAAVQALKLAEDSEEIVIRLQELAGATAPDLEVSFARPLLAIREVDGAEKTLDTPPVAGSVRTLDGSVRGPAPARLAPSGTLLTGLAPFQPRAFALSPGAAPVRLEPPACLPLELVFDLDGISRDDDPSDGDFDGAGHALAGELLPVQVVREGIPFTIGPDGPGQANVLLCRGQTVRLPRGHYNRLYVLAAAVGGGRRAVFAVDGQTTSFWVQDYSEPIGQWDSRLVGNLFTEDPAAMTPAYINRAEVAWVGTHRHDRELGNEAYVLTYAFKHGTDLPATAREIVLPDDENIRLLAMTLARDENTQLIPAQPLYDRCRTTSVAIQASRRAFLDSCLITLSSPNPDARIHYTLDGSPPSDDSPLYRKPFALYETATVQAAAYSLDVPEPSSVRTSLTKLSPRPARYDEHDAAVELAPGLKCRYYEIAGTALPDFSALEPVKEALVPRIAVPDFARPEDVGLVLTGFLLAPQDGLYTLHLWSDDGSALYLGDQKLIDNDGLHGRAEGRMEAALAQGWHPMTVIFFQHLGGIALELWWEGPGIDLQPVAESQFRHSVR
jgi:alpha-mannosidase